MDDTLDYIEVNDGGESRKIEIADKAVRNTLNVSYINNIAAGIKTGSVLLNISRRGLMGNAVKTSSYSISLDAATTTSAGVMSAAQALVIEAMRVLNKTRNIFTPSCDSWKRGAARYESSDIDISMCLKPFADYTEDELSAILPMVDNREVEFYLMGGRRAKCGVNYVDRSGRTLLFKGGLDTSELPEQNEMLRIFDSDTIYDIEVEVNLEAKTQHLTVTRRCKSAKALEAAMPSLVEEAKKALVVDQWQALTPALYASTIYGYDSETGLFSIKWSYSQGEADAYQFTDLTYDEVLRMLLNIPKATLTYDCFFNGARTNIMPFGYNRGSGNKLQVLEGNAMVYNAYTEVLMLSHPNVNVVLSGTLTFAGDNKLRAIIGKCNYASRTANPFYFVGKWPKLEYMRPMLKQDFNCSTSPLLTLGTFQFMVEKGSEGITITVHPDVYAKLTDESNTEWHKVLTDAEAKNIKFATVEENTTQNDENE